MFFQNVCIEAWACTLPDEVVTSAEIENRLEPVYRRLRLPEGRLELMSGIRERRFFRRGTRPGDISGATVREAMAASGIAPARFGALIHGSVCRDQLEPATASGVHAAAGLPDDLLLLDVSNACLGLLNGMLLIASMIELGQIQAGIAVGTEVGRDLVEGTIDSLLANDGITRQDVKRAFASLTIGSGSAAVVLCDRRLSRFGTRLLGGECLSDTSAHQLCEGGVDSMSADGRPLMQTDSEALLHAGVALADRTWQKTSTTLQWPTSEVDRVFTHQVGRAHRKLLLETLGFCGEQDFPTVEFLGNTGSVALPTTATLGIERGHLTDGDRVALLGIGSGLNSVMLGLQWQGGAAVSRSETA